MATISRKDVSISEENGTATYRDQVIVVSEDHLARWKEDPDGRFSIKPALEGHSIELDRFFPSL